MDRRIKTDVVGFGQIRDTWANRGGDVLNQNGPVSAPVRAYDNSFDFSDYQTVQTPPNHSMANLSHSQGVSPSSYNQPSHFQPAQSQPPQPNYSSWQPPVSKTPAQPKPVYQTQIDDDPFGFGIGFPTQNPGQNTTKSGYQPVPTTNAGPTPPKAGGGSKPAEMDAFSDLF